MKTHAQIYPLLPIALTCALLIARSAPLSTPAPTKTYGTMVLISANRTNAWQAYTNLLATSPVNKVTITTNELIGKPTNHFLYKVSIEFKH